MGPQENWIDDELDDDCDESDAALLGTPPLAEIIITPVTLITARDRGPIEDDANHLKPN